MGPRSARQPEEAVYLKPVDRAHRRYLSAIKTLAQVRKLGVPAVRVNIGEKQVNIAASRR